MRKFLSDILVKASLGVEQNAYVLGYMGIGTSSASQKLEVSGGDALIRNAFIGLIPSYGVNYASFSHTSRAGSEKYSFLSGNAGDTYVNSANGQPIYFRHENIDNVTILPNGNVGIGTTSPGAKLEVTANAGGTTLLLGRTGGNSSIKALNDNGGYLALDSTGGAVILNHYSSDNIWMVTGGGKVGIGTSSPAYKLDVTGGFRVNGTNGEFIVDGTGNDIYLTRNGSNYLIADKANSAISFLMGTSYTQSLFLKNNGYVGIGTTSPAVKLHVAGTSETSVRVSDSGGSYMELYQQSTDSYILASNALRFYNGGSERMRITSGGNVGIGTTSPAAKLQVYGDIASTYGGSNGYIALQAGTSTVQGYVEWFKPGPSRVAYMGYNDGSTANNLAITLESSANFIVNGGNVGIGTTSPSEKLFVNSGGAYMDTTVSYGTNTKGIVINQEDGTGYGTGLWFRQSGLTAGIGSTRVNSSDWATDLRFYTHPSSTTNQNTLYERMRINSEGNVGIGTSAPYEKLEVNGAISATGLANGTSAQGHSTTLAVYGGTSYIYAVDWGAEFKPLSVQGKTISLETGTGSTTPRLFIDNSGNVGIGTSSPLAKLQVSSGRSYLFSGDNYSIGLAQTAAQGNYMYLGTAADGTFYISETGGSARVTVQQGGNVGIGSTSPGALLQVGYQNTTSDNLVRLGVSYNTGRSARGGITWHDGGNVTGKIYTEYDGAQVSMVFGSLYNAGYNSNQLMTIRGNGNVGIGTTSPSSRLEIQNSSYDGLTLSRTAQSAGSYIQSKSYDTSNVLRVSNTIVFGASAGASRSDGFIALSTANADVLTERMRINSLGNVGIGTTSPSYKLDANGGFADGSNNYIATFHSNTGTAGDAYVGIGAYRSDSLGSGRNAYINAVAPSGGTGNLGLQIAGGNVGIGTTSPVSKLQVQDGDIRLQSSGGNPSILFGSYNISTSYPQGSMVLSDAGFYGGNFDFYTKANGAANNGLNFIMRLGSDGNVGIGTTSPSEILHIKSSAPVIRQEKTGILNWYSGNVTGNNYTIYPDSATNSTFNITSTGNVGIGTTSPAARFTVQTTTVSSADSFRITDGTGVVNIGHWDTVTNRFEFSGKPTTFIQYGAGNYISWGTNGSERMRLDASGNLGIGTSSPLGMLQVSGGVNISRDGAAGTPVGQLGIYVNPGTGATTNAISFQYSGNALTTIASYNAGSYYQDIIVSTSNGVASPSLVEVLRIKGQTGNVGIGTSSPSYKLDVVNSNSSVFAIKNTESIYGNGQLKNIDFYGRWWSGDPTFMQLQGRISSQHTADGYRSGNLKFYTVENGTVVDAVTIAAGGNVGIGTTSPDSKLQITSTGSNVFRMVRSQNNFGFEATSTSSGGYGLYDYQASAYDIYFKAGKVGIGTTTPATKLEVYGGHGDTTARLYSFGNGSGLDASLDMWASEPGVSYPGSGIGNNVNGQPYYGRRNSSLPQSYIRFYDGEVILNTGSTTASPTLTVKANGNVGIGTISPSQKLHVLGNAVVTGFINAGTGTDNAQIGPGYLGFYNAGSSPKYIKLSDDASTIDAIGFSKSGSASTTWFPSGNVGIGTTSPNRRLTVFDTANNYQLRIGYSDSYYYDLGRNSSDGYFAFYGNQTGYTGYRFGGVDGTHLTITPTGNVGIGTTSPTEKLHVVGRGIFESNVRIYPVSETWAEGLSFIMPTTSTWGGLRWQRQRGNNDGNWYVGFTALDSTDDLVFGANNGGSQVNNIIRLTKAGNVGIGTSSPSAKLEVSGDAYVSEQFSQGVSIASKIANYGAEFRSNGSSAQIFFGRSGNSVGSGAIGADASNVFAIWSVPSFSRLLVVNQNGNVGIGTSSPAYKLDVNGDIRTSSYFVGGSSGQGFTWGNFTYGSYIDVDNSQNALRIRNTSGTIMLEINGYSNYFTGKVGIGTTTPQTFLTLNGANVSYAGQLQIASNDYAQITFYNSSALTPGSSNRKASLIYNVGGNTFEIANQITNGHLILQGSDSGGGNVGIGTTSPTYKLSVESSTNTSVSISSPYGYQTALELKGADQWYRLISQPSSNNYRFDIYNQTLGAYAFSIASNSDAYLYGRVGIGTTNPYSNLQIQASSNTRLLVQVVGTEAAGDNAGLYFKSAVHYSDAYIKAAVLFSNNGTGYGRGDLILATNNAGDSTNVSTSDSKLIVKASGNVGIGITNPSFKLHVVGVVGIGQNTNGTATIDAYGGNAYYGCDGTQITVNGNSGNVGIGNTVPSSKLDVISTATQIADFRSTITDGLSNIRIVNDQQTTSTGNSPAAIELVGKRGSSTHGRHAWIGAEGVDGTTFRTQIQFKVRPEDSPYQWSTLPTQMVIDGNGNVGIGTTSPTAALHIARTASIAPVIVLQTTDSTSNGFIVWKNSAGTQNAAIGTNYNVGDTGAIEFINGSTTNMILRSSGNVGIGTTSPSDKLVVNSSNSRVATFSNPNASQTVYFGSSAQSQYSDIILQVDNGQAELFRNGSGYSSYGGVSALNIWNSNGAIAFHPNNVSNVMYLSTGGNVGIGTTSPAEKLQVVGSASIINVKSTTTGANANIHFETTARKWGVGANMALNNSSFEIYDYTAFSNRLTIDSSGYLGIGTTSPQSKLHIETSASNPFRMVRGTTNFGFEIGGGTIGLYDYEDSIYRWYVDSVGNVGINTTSPSYKLHVEGNVSGISIYASHDIAAFSDITVKKDVQKIENAIDKVKELNGYTYVRTDDETNTRRAGVIAQEVQKVLPEVVSANPDGTLNVAYSNMIALLIEGMKEQQATIERLENRIKQLEK